MSAVDRKRYLALLKEFYDKVEEEGGGDVRTETKLILGFGEKEGDILGKAGSPRLEELRKQTDKMGADIYNFNKIKDWSGGRLITMRKKDYLREHHHLFKVLSHPTKKKLLKELMAQQKELKKRGLKGGKTRRSRK